MAADDRWYFTKEQIYNSPSRKCGIEHEKELSYRQQAANLIQDMGQSLSVNQLCMNTAIVYMHRFYAFHSFTKLKWNAMAACCLFLAAKVEEQPRKLEHVIKVQHMCLHREATPLDTKSDHYLEIAQELVINENLLLQTLGFDIGIEQPNSHVVNCCERVHATRDLAQTSYIMATESLHLTTMCLQYKPAVVACVCIHLACKWCKWELPNSSQGKPWYWYVEETVTADLLEALTSEFLGILEKYPNRLKKKLMNARKDCVSEYSKKDSHSSSSVRSSDPSSKAPQHGQHPRKVNSSNRKEQRSHVEKLQKDVQPVSGSGNITGANVPNSKHSIVKPPKIDSPNVNRKRVAGYDEKMQTCPPSSSNPDSKIHPNKKLKVEGPASVTIHEWKERREKEKLLHTKQKQMVNQEKVPAQGQEVNKTDAVHKMKHHQHYDIAKSRSASSQDGSLHHPAEQHHARVDSHKSHSHHREKFSANSDKRKLISGSYVKDKHTGGAVQSTHDGNASTKCHERELKQSRVDVVSQTHIPGDKTFHRIAETMDRMKHISPNEIRKPDNLPVNVLRTNIESVLHMTGSSDEIPSKQSSSSKSAVHTSMKNNVERINEPHMPSSADKLFDDLISASNKTVNKMTSDDYSSPSGSLTKTDSSEVSENSILLQLAASGDMNYKDNSAPIKCEQKSHARENGDKISASSKSTQLRVSPRKRTSSSSSQKTPPNSAECRRSSRLKTPPITSPTASDKRHSKDVFSPFKDHVGNQEILKDNLQPFVKIERIEVDKGSQNAVGQNDQLVQDQDSSNKVISHNQEQHVQSVPPKQDGSSQGVRGFPTDMPDRNLEPEPMDIETISEQPALPEVVVRDKSERKKDRHKSSKKEKHRRKHSHSDHHRDREKNHHIKLTIAKDTSKCSPSYSSGGGGLKFKISKQRMTAEHTPSHTNDNTNLGVGSGGGIKIVIPKSKLSNTTENGNPSSKSEKRKDKSLRSSHQKLPKGSRSHKHQFKKEENVPVAESKDIESSSANPYYMPPIGGKPVPSYSHPQQYCPTPAAFHPASVRQPFPGYAVFGSSFSQPPLPREPPPTVPPPPPNK